jgi:hypothetical protein
MTGFEGEEAPPARLPELHGDILAWSSDVYYHGGDDVWRAIETMQKYRVPVPEGDGNIFQTHDVKQGDEKRCPFGYYHSR